ncbi:cryptochrome/photolyase family protein [Derxia gummosa]|uniref:Deoxyribodipyrimidine photo-lyase n=1 Tax=Derxia gummosa DSM 723 TaxID=1121388 RepID=A0A9U5CGL0_9BURK|nr:deoxyribodipyrimidine photo-lyase [Derxia gummosa]
MADTHSTALVWLRRDLRDHDHAALAAALRQAQAVHVAFVFDTDILAPLLDGARNAFASTRDRRVEFIRESLADLDAALRRRGGGLIVRHARAVDEIPRLAAALGAEVVYANRDYEPAAVARDDAVGHALKAAGRRLGILRDQVVFDRDDLMTGSGRFYSVFTPYSKAWRRNLTAERVAERRCDGPGRFAPPPARPAPDGSADPRPLDAPIPALADLGFAPAGLDIGGLAPGMTGAARVLDAFLPRIGRYDRTRDIPHLDATSRLSAHLRFGTVSLRGLVRAALAHGANGGEPRAADGGNSDRAGRRDNSPASLAAASGGAATDPADDAGNDASPDDDAAQPALDLGDTGIATAGRATAPADPEARNGADVWLNELIWREFYFQILHHAPRIADGAAFKPEYDRIRWAEGAEADAHFAAWCEGRTGYPIVDAAMAQFNASGFMHNRLRMVVASFLVKDLGIDWRRGEAYFAARLNDFDFAANNGGWQWCASSGCDAQPWFRIFNPSSQSLKFDPEARFLRHWLPALGKVPADAIHDPLRLATAARRAGIRLGRDYPAPIVEHDAARKLTLERYAVVKKE